MARRKRTSTSPLRAERESPTYLPMGIDEQMLVRMQRPLRREFEQLYDDVYGALPRPGLGAFITWLATEGADVVRRRYGR